MRVRFGSKADIYAAKRQVRFTPESSHRLHDFTVASPRRAKPKARRLRPHRFFFQIRESSKAYGVGPPAGLGFKYAMAVRATVNAPPVCGQIPSGHVVPIAANQHCTTSITVSSLTYGVVNIPCKDVMKARIHGYLACSLQRLRWCRRNIPHFPIRMEGREMQRHIGTKMVQQPGTLRIDFVG